MTTKTKQFVVVTTEHRGVFGGTLECYDPATKQAELTDAQMCVYWSADVRGVLGLAATGPTKSCKITPAVPRMTLEAVTAVAEATPAAAKAWAGKPWS